MAIPNVTPYSGQKPVPGQDQPTFNQNMSDELDYFNALPAELNTAIDAINQAATDVDDAKTAAEAAASEAATSATAAAASGNYQGDFQSGVTSATAGESYSFGDSTWLCLANTTTDPAVGNSNWRKVVSADDVNEAEERLLGTGAKIYRGSNGKYVQDGDIVPAGTTHLAVLINGKVEDAAMSPVASGAVSLLTDTNATIGVTTVDFTQWRKLEYFSGGGNSAVENMVAGIPIAADVDDICNAEGAIFKRLQNTGADSDFRLLGLMPSYSKETLKSIAEFINNAGGQVTIPNGSTPISSPIFTDSSSNENKLHISGYEKNTSELEVSSTEPAVWVRESYTADNMKISSLIQGQGVGFQTSDTKQTQRSKSDNLQFDGLRQCIWKRYSFNDSYKDIHSVNSTAGIVLSRHAYQSDNSNPEPTGRWNSGSDGFFHNVISLDNVFINRGEVGIWGVTMCGAYDNITCQQQSSDGTSNDVLPSGLQGTGLFIDSAVSGSKTGQWGNTVRNYYTEDSKVGLRVNDQRYLGIDMMFTQGGSSNDRAEAGIISDNSVIYARGVTGQDFFDDVFVANNNTRMYLDECDGTYAGTRYAADATSVIYPRGVCDKDKESYQLEKTTSSDTTFVLPLEIPKGGEARLSVRFVDSSGQRRRGYAIIQTFREGGIAPYIDWVDPVGAPLNTTTVMVGNNVQITITGTNTTTATATLELTYAPDVTQTDINLTGV